MQLITGQDARVAAWLFETSNCSPMQYNLAVGLSEDGGETLCGGILFTNWNGSDAEVHFHGVGHLTRRVVRAIFYIAATTFNLNRLTIRTRKESMARGVVKLGAQYEGTIRRLYGPTDEDKDAGRQYAFFRETIEKLAGLRKA